MFSVSAINKPNFVFLALLLLSLLSVRLGIAAESLVDINSAGAPELAEQLSGIGPAKAKAIVAYREQHGPFQTLDELINVKGIGPRTLEKIRECLVVNASSGLAQTPGVFAATTAPDFGSQAEIERETRRAVRSVLSIARRSSVKRMD